jgi:hypothetical protein
MRDEERDQLRKGAFQAESLGTRIFSILFLDLFAASVTIGDSGSHERGATG